MNSSQLLIGIPFCNEYDNLIRLIKDLELWHPKFKYDLVFVNDGSTDNSENLVSQNNYKTITSKENKSMGSYPQLNAQLGPVILEPLRIKEHTNY